MSFCSSTFFKGSPLIVFCSKSFNLQDYDRQIQISHIDSITEECFLLAADCRTLAAVGELQIDLKFVIGNRDIDIPILNVFYFVMQSQARCPAEIYTYNFISNLMLY